jgi:hypothetical protein
MTLNKKLCSVKGCDRYEEHKRGKYVGLCAGHKNQIQQGRATRDNLKAFTRAPARINKKPLHDRFFSKVEKTETCWNWTGTLVQGYGCTSVNGRSKRAHRVSYELLVGPLEQATILHHKCANRKCVNPDHLQVVSYTENMAEMFERNAYIKKIKFLEEENKQLREMLGI